MNRYMCMVHGWIDGQLMTGSSLMAVGLMMYGCWMVGNGCIDSSMDAGLLLDGGQWMDT